MAISRCLAVARAESSVVRFIETMNTSSAAIAMTIAKGWANRSRKKLNPLSPG